MGTVKEIYEQFSGQADFLTIYIKEAHPDDEWQMDVNLKEDVCYVQPTSLAGRVRIANDFCQRFDYPLPVGVDTMDNRAMELYSAWPERLYIIDSEGRIAYKDGTGPFDYKPEEVRAWLAARFPAPVARR